jgi:hypothetical protein
VEVAGLAVYRLKFITGKIVLECWTKKPQLYCYESDRLQLKNFGTMKRRIAMKIVASLLMVGLMATPALAATQTLNDVSVVDVACSKSVAAGGDAHTRKCAIGCKDSGFGVLTTDDKFLKFDANGNAKILEALKASDKKDHLRVDVTGDVQGDTIKVVSVKLL